ncbi:MAG TPA: PQQ-dependent sugar dehydrogenase, partial [Anaerolineae bacterium]
MNSKLRGLILLGIAAGIGTLLLSLRFERQVVSAAPATIIWPTISLHSLPSAFAQPVYVTHAGDNSGRLFIVERAGTIRIWKNGALLPAPFLDITSRVQSGYIEQGLLSVAFPPGYATKGYFYVDYTNKTGIGNTIIARYSITANPDVADPNSEQVILNITQPEVNHNGGQLQFGPDGYLYIGMGDGGGGGDQHGTIGNAQDPSTLLGKLLRINVEPSQHSGPVLPGATFMTFLPFISKAGSFFTYSIPATNPYTTTAGYRGEIWALGLRNPWRFSFDRQTGDLYIADVGQDSYEEVDFQPASSAGGENYGWRILEGNHCYNPPTGCIPP